MDHFISMYIDNELSLNEKILFVEQCSNNRRYTDETVSLLRQEKMLSKTLNRTAPLVESPTPAPGQKLSLLSLGWAIAACLLIILSYPLVKGHIIPSQKHIALQDTTEQPKVPYRFVIQQEQTESVEITGSFTDWQPVALSPTGSEGYWEVYLKIPEGEHRYTYIIDGSTYIPDPTVPGREPDDFGSTNTILKIKA